MCTSPHFYKIPDVKRAVASVYESRFFFLGYKQKHGPAFFKVAVLFLILYGLVYLWADKMLPSTYGCIYCLNYQTHCVIT